MFVLFITIDLLFDELFAQCETVPWFLQGVHQGFAEWLGLDEYARRRINKGVLL